MSFSFGFSGDDIDQEPDSSQQEIVAISDSTNATSVTTDAIPAQSHKIEDLLSALPDQIAYTTSIITSPNGNTICLPRRELFDIRVQLMAEDDDSTPDLLSGLEDSDIRTNVYEGGFKTWECSIDLVRYLLDRGPRKDLDDLHRVDHVVELGAGTALPTLTLFHYALTHSLPLYITVADYNPTVITHSILPNLLLTFITTLPATISPFSDKNPNPLAPGATFNPTSTIQITTELLQSFKSTLSSIPLTLTLISGSWSSDSFLSLLPHTPTLRTFVLASETIYSPIALTSFTDVLASLLKRVNAGKALIAAKKVYFGVGGSVDAFRDEASRKGLVAWEAEFEGLGNDGVRRCVVEVQTVGGGEV